MCNRIDIGIANSPIWEMGGLVASEGQWLKKRGIIEIVQQKR